MDAMKQVCEIGCEEESWDVRVKACRSQSPCPPARRAPFGALGAPLEIATLGKNIRNAGSPARAARPEMEGHAAWRQRRWRRDGGEQGRRTCAVILRCISAKCLVLGQGHAQRRERVRCGDD
jgi:hypothetical protein